MLSLIRFTCSSLSLSFPFSTKNSYSSTWIRFVQQKELKRFPQFALFTTFSKALFYEIQWKAEISNNKHFVFTEIPHLFVWRIHNKKTFFPLSRIKKMTQKSRKRIWVETKNYLKNSPDVYTLNFFRSVQIEVE